MSPKTSRSTPVLILGLALTLGWATGTANPALATGRAAATHSVRTSLGQSVAGVAAAGIQARLHNIAPSPNYFSVCAYGTNSAACTRQVIKAIENARSHEHMKKRAVILPNNYRKLSVPEQTFVITDLERVDRGLRPYTGLTATLNTAAHVAAIAQVDPTLVTSVLNALHIEALGSIWAGDLGPLASDYDWMYNDGYAKGGSINIACLRPGASGCWGHRHNILYPNRGLSTLSAGAGTAKPPGASIAEVLVGGNARAPRYSYTWREALAHGANGHRITHH